MYGHIANTIKTEFEFILSLAVDDMQNTYIYIINIVLRTSETFVENLLKCRVPRLLITGSIH